MSAPTTTPNKFDPLRLIGHLFAYARHVRLMVLMAAVGLLIGITAFLYTTPTFSARSLITVHGFGTPLTNREVSELGERPSFFSRTFLDRFRSPRVQLGAARKLGLLQDDESTLEDLVRIVPAVRVGLVDARNLEIHVLAYDPDVVRKFGEEMVYEFLRQQEEGWREFRDEAIERYAQQLVELDKKIKETVENLNNIEKNQNFTKLTMEERSLLEIPREKIRVEQKLKNMEDMLRVLESLETAQANAAATAATAAGTENGTQIAADDTESVLRLLSLLGNFEKDSEVVVGQVVNRTTPQDAISATKGPEVIVQPSDIETEQPWRELERKKRQIETEIVEASKKYLPDSDVMKNLTKALDDTKRGLLAEASMLRRKFDLEYAKLKEKLPILENRMPEYEAISKQLGLTAWEVSSVVDAQKMWDRAREVLSQKLSAITINEDFDWVQIRFKEHLSLRDKVPISPNKYKLAILSIIIALAGALGVPTILNIFDTSATSVQQLEDSLGLTGIGIVPLTSQEFLEEVHRSPAQGATVPNYLLENFRIIRSNICLHPNHRDRSQVVLVTSSRPQEGKTTQAANLAWAFHSMGERTLLLDCDLRRGRVHSLAKLDNSIGMTRLLMGEVPPDQAIQTIGKDGFDVIPRGPVIAGTTEILCQARFEQLLELFRKHYDRIVIDSPPVLGLSESSSLQRVVDGTVLVVRSEATSRKDVLDAVTLLRKSEAHFFGFVLNAVDLSKASNYYQYYYYSAPYYDQFIPEDDTPGNPPSLSGPAPRPRPGTAPVPAVSASV
jgi:succinoglycan biosynthesis transport protein ExoP